MWQKRVTTEDLYLYLLWTISYRNQLYMSLTMCAKTGGVLCDDLTFSATFSPGTSNMETLMEYRRCTKNNSPDALPQKCRLPVVPKHLYYSTYILSTPITAAGVERANSTLRFVTNVYRSQMTEDRLNSFLLLYVHKDVVLNYDNIIDMSMQLKILDGCI